MKKFRQSASYLEEVKKSIELAKELERGRFKMSVREKNKSILKLVLIGTVCLLLAIFF